MGVGSRIEDVLKSGFVSIPVRVETETIIPSSRSDAPKNAARIGSRGVFPI